jgi:hypothetical protein
MERGILDGIRIWRQKTGVKIASDKLALSPAMQFDWAVGEYAL